MKKSLFESLIHENLTTLKIRYDWKQDKVRLFAAKEWDEDIKWCRYNKDFYMESLLTDRAVYLNDTEVKELYKKYHLSDYLNNIIKLFRKGKHFGIDCFYYGKKNIRFISYMHNNLLALNNRSHSIRTGGIRRHDYKDEEYDVIVDGFNLSRAMSFKNVAAEIPYGGSKITVQSDPVELDDMEEIGFLSYAVDRTRSFPSPDMGYPQELAEVMKKNFTLNMCGGLQGPIGPMGTPTAYGTYLAVKQAAKFMWGLDSLKNKKIAIQGLGAVGFYLAEHYLKEGAKLIICDIDEKPIKNLKEKYPDKNISVVNPDEIYFVEADIFSPCAMGGIITADRIPKMKFYIIIGAANNQLNAISQEEEYELARLLQKHKILFQVAWWHNVGGVLAAWEEYINQDAADLKHILPKIERICIKNTWDNLNKAKKLSITPTECAYKSAEKYLYK